MIHVLDGKWQLKNYPPAVLDARRLYNLAKFRDMQAKNIDINEIAYKELNCIDSNSPRYILADTLYPCVVVENMENPFYKPFRMVDGRHRLLKNLRMGVTTINCYVFNTYDVFKFIDFSL